MTVFYNLRKEVYGNMNHMKKATFAVCATVIGVLMLLAAALPSTAAGNTSYIRGDANGDGRVNVADVTTVQRILADMEEDADGMKAKRADIDGNGLTVSDATEIQKYVAEFENIYHIGEAVEETQPTDTTKPHFTTDPYELPFIPA